MVNDRYLPNSYLEPVKEKEKMLDLVKTQVYSLCTELNRNAKEQSYNTVYCGVAGLIYMNQILYEHDKCEEHLENGKKIVEFLKGTKFRHMISFLEGSSGFRSLIIMLQFYLNKGKITEDNENTELLKELNELMNIFFQKKDELLHIDNDQNELLYGKCGLIYSFLFCKQVWLNFRTYRCKILTILYLLTNSIFNYGKKYSTLNQSRVPLSLYFEWHGSVYLGAAHGYAEHVEDIRKELNNMGINENVEVVRETLKRELIEHIELIYKVTDEILDLYVTSEYNVYSSVKKEKIEHKKKENLIQWCHGNPGYIILLIELLKKENIKILENLIDEEFSQNISDIQKRFENKHNSLVEKMGLLLWEKGLLVKGCGLCHGIAGNGILFLYIYNYTKDEKWYIKALQYGYFCIQNFKQLYDVPDRPDSLFEGYAGLVVFLSFLLKPELTYFPAHDFSKAIKV